MPSARALCRTAGSCTLDVGATVEVPEQLIVSAAELARHRNPLGGAALAVDFDTLDFRIEC